MSLEQLRQNAMMSHLLDALESGEDIGHYGRLTFAIIAHHLLDDAELVDWLDKDPTIDERKAKALCHQVATRDYSPPNQQTLRQWQAQQDFPICPDIDDPDACNPYRDLELPEEVYAHITEYHAEKAEAGG